jgi:formyltetrahydrofolate hydrolase
MPTPKTAILLIDTPDRKGIVVTIVNFLVERYDVNSLHADQHQDVEASSTGARSSKLVACVLSSILA